MEQEKKRPGRPKTKPENNPEVKAEAVPQKPAEKKLEYTVCAIRTETGTWTYFHDINAVSLKAGDDRICLAVSEWQELMKELPEVFRVLGAR